MIFDTLKYIGKIFNDNNINWAVGASILLKKYDLITRPNDIDILVDIKDIETIDLILKSIGEKRKSEKIEIYSTEYFYEYVVNGIDIDIMAGFTINHENGKYRYIFDNKSISSIEIIDGIKIPFTALEDWYVIYQLIKGRENKVGLIEKYLKLNGIKRVDLLNRALKEQLPLSVINNIMNIIEIS
ncbi:hypothetical protein [Clostridium fallax]|uniref:Nucleotidyl transferase AbiEii toxin, Type IV TA system n=1 Tax=Clostridium fallax TaxID=1533 RepID=A0A1M4VNW6_9CLOT|nr:hypothetical protein [Clostridium fallax]SHE70801.1 hypothetical protein SAMN05443638_10879 [Clostridium fallax]SQB22821.1 Uncharacterised protein [Clostridium fallax]